MLLASYKSTRPGIQGVANRVIRWRLRGPYSHSEIVFEPGDRVGQWMPDGTCQPDADGALWCVSSVAVERMPAWSKRRAGRCGGVRFKRIKLDPARWDTVHLTHFDPRHTAAAGRFMEGHLYDWQGVLGFASWLIPHKRQRWSCAELCAELPGVAGSWRFDPCSLHFAMEAVQ